MLLMCGMICLCLVLFPFHGRIVHADIYFHCAKCSLYFLVPIAVHGKTTMGTCLVPDALHGEITVQTCVVTSDLLSTV